MSLDTRPNDGWVSLHDLHRAHSAAVDQEMNKPGRKLMEYLMRSPDSMTWTEQDDDEA